ncbi:hypothetical protein PAESOLCIP111_01251 [Paenibacillus solanacearum]|uniref:Extracellular solute-binding protein n=1 Tax=Paenibacillus solanacearum TaxID=2048548 RepID=A0A916JWT5_9BACL|nr:extracellular solute-binding protein [Paenibacillus solanacearum]CAG7610517.1 hypothetical protein PAESOLCIP111_01251 [Paenibacillus solanacearum]
MIKRFVFMLIAVILVLSTACTNHAGQPNSTGNPAEANNPDKGKAPDPVTVKLMTYKSMFTEEDFAKYVQNPVKAKYPHITVELMPINGNITDMVASGSLPDLYYLWFASIKPLSELNAVADLEPLIQKNKFDTNVIEAETLKSMKVMSGLDKIHVLPIYYNGNALMYNKDIFERFGEKPPVDGMTWEKVRDLGIKISKADGNGEYFGFWPDRVFRLSMQVNTPFVNSAGKANVITDAWREHFELWKSIYEPQKLAYGWQDFSKGKIAMCACSISTIRDALKNPNLNFDLVTYPEHKTLPGVSTRPDGIFTGISSVSEKKDAAFLVMQTLLSDEVQTAFTRNGNMSAVNKPSIRDQFMADIPAMKGKNVKAITNRKFAVATYVPSNNDTNAETIAGDVFAQMMKEGQDTNTALRIANEKVQALLDTIK